MDEIFTFSVQPVVLSKGNRGNIHPVAKYTSCFFCLGPKFMGKILSYFLLSLLMYKHVLDIQYMV